MKELSLRSKYGINVMAIKRNNEVNISPDADDVINKDDIVVAIGSAEDLTKLEGKIFRH